MKEQDLRDKFIAEGCLFANADQCVQIAKDYVEQESIEFAEWLLNSQYLYELGMKTKTLEECYQLFKNK